METPVKQFTVGEEEMVLVPRKDYINKAALLVRLKMTINNADALYYYDDYEHGREAYADGLLWEIENGDYSE